MVIAVAGASGFLGTNLISHLLATTNHRIVGISRRGSQTQVPEHDAARLKLVDGNILDEEQMTEILEGVDVAYFFVHMMGQKNKDFYTQEAVSAHRFSAAVLAAGVERVIFMGGLGDDHTELSAHLASRHNTGTVLRENLPLVVEFRASMIIGNGSVAYDIIRNLVHRMPIMTLPRWSSTLTQPIALVDALEYLTLAASVPLKHHEIIEIGGPTVLSYRDLYRQYATFIGRHPLLVIIPFIPEWLGGWWLNLTMPNKHAKIGRIMVHSMSNPMVVTHNRAKVLFPSVKLHSIQDAFEAAKLSLPIKTDN